MTTVRMPFAEACADTTGIERLAFYSEFDGECILWTGRTSDDGYGKLKVAQRSWKAHRLAYSVLVGEIPKGLEIDHLCMVRNCINPDHLEAVTHAENSRRSFNIGGVNGRKTCCKRGHEFTPENTFVKRRGNGWVRRCRTCTRERRTRKVICEICGRETSYQYLGKHLRHHEAGTARPLSYARIEAAR